MVSSGNKAYMCKNMQTKMGVQDCKSGVIESSAYDKNTCDNWPETAMGIGTCIYTNMN